ncbi:exopolygalacturonase-like [Amaranthus tricolor]|uniref:exopolygalacturonase-like n=1 Tax=Amaranthus tricolor TaxID=29722 RepID=UPI00258543CA|nr:exopolygalacturonase-like [Amaranthus tricolor]
MDFKASLTKNSLILVLIFCLITKGQCQVKFFTLENYGAVKGGEVDNSKVLVKAWNDACKWKGASRLDISSETYFVNPVILSGPCSGPIEFHNSGTLKAPLSLKPGSWIEFRHINRLTLTGGGSFDGQGPPKQPNSRLSSMLSLSFVTNSKAENIKLRNSQGTHLILFAVNNTELNEIRISSPEESHNTDGIKIGASNGITITNSNIASGDDCIAILTGSKNITISGVNCGPGHGISIGSMGHSPNEHVDHVTVKHCNLSGTTNGLRIKTWATDYPGTVSNIQYQEIIMDNVYNPIIFDQHYCDAGSCGQGTSKVEIQDVTFSNIHGTSRSKIAVNLQCSRSTPCNRIELEDINIKYNGEDGTSISNCSYASGKVSGVQLPKPCPLFS